MFILKISWGIDILSKIKHCPSQIMAFINAGTLLHFAIYYPYCLKFMELLLAGISFLTKSVVSLML